MNESLKAEHQRPEGAAIEAARKRKHLSQRQIAKAANISEGRARQIINGYKSEGGYVLSVIGPADTVARLAMTVDLDGPAMRQAGREDVAAILESTSHVDEDGNLWLQDTSVLVDDLRDWTNSDGEDGPPVGALQLWEVTDLLYAADQKHRAEMKLLNDVVKAMRKAGKEGDGDVKEPRDSAPTSEGVTDERSTATQADYALSAKEGESAGRKMRQDQDEAGEESQDPGMDEPA